MLHCSGPCQPRNASPVPDCHALYMCVRNAASDSKIVSQTSHLCSVDAAATTSPKLYAGKSRAHAAFIHHGLPRLGELDPQFVPWPRVRTELWKIGGAKGMQILNDQYHTWSGLSSRILQKSSELRQPRSGGSRHVSQSFTAQQRWYAWYAQFRTELGIRCAVPCTTTSPCTLTQHPHVSRVETLQHCRRARSPGPRCEEKDGPQQRVCQPQCGPE